MENSKEVFQLNDLEVVELEKILMGLSGLSYRDSSPLIEKIKRQYAEQVTASQKTKVAEREAIVSEELAKKE